MTENRTLEVYYHEKKVGTLAETRDKRVAFQYSDDWIKTGFSISPFSLPLKNEVFIPPESSRTRFGGLFGVFADSLPDSWGQLLLDRYLENFGLQRGSLSALERLAYVGRSGMGALEYVPSKESDFGIEVSGLDFDVIAGECEKILSSKTSDKLDLLFQMGGSSGGTRPKILLSEEGREWIVKFPAKNDPDISGKREYDYSLCAKECGIIMTDTELVKSKVCDGYFRTARFDRINGNKIFSVTFAALLEADFRAPTCDYEMLFKLVNVLTKDNRADKEQLFRIMCFNAAAHNNDDHTKNFSFIYTDGKGWRLAPAYDLTYSDTYWGEHTTSVNGKGKDITRENLVNAGTDAGLPESFCRECVEEIYEKTKSLGKYLKQTGAKKGKKMSFKERIEDIVN